MSSESAGWDVANRAFEGLKKIQDAADDAAKLLQATEIHPGLRVSEVLETMQAREQIFAKAIALIVNEVRGIRDDSAAIIDSLED